MRETVKKLRDTYRATQLQHETAKAKAVAALYDKYDQTLAAIQADLTKAKKLDEALTLKSVRDQIGQRKAAVLVMKPAAITVVPTSVAAVPSSGFTNSLGMKFVPIPDTDVLMCIHETRRQDFAFFAKETSYADNAWANSRAKGHATASGHEDDHPVVGVTWEHAVVFCEWLSKREGRSYKLPSDREWSRAVGLQEPEGTPKSLSGNVPDHYAWGNSWPPPVRAGNFLDVACWKDMAVPDFAKPDYHDGFPTTAPVMSFPPNSLGIFDLAGNVTEWCMDWYDADKTEHVSRGSAWYRPVDRGLQNASFREHTKVGFRNNGIGFRVVVKIMAASSVTSATATSVLAPKAPTPPPAPDTGFTNSLGMKTVLPEAVFFGTTGQVSVIGRDGKITVGGVALPQGATVTALITPGSIVKTGPASSADLALSGGGSIRLEAESEMKLSEAVAGQTASESLELLKGRLFMHLDAADLAKSERIELRLKTPSAVIAVHGAKCFAEIGSTYETIGVFKGTAEVTETKQGGKALVKDDMAVAVKPGTLSKPRRLSMEQTGLRKICDQIELVRTESSLMPQDASYGATFEDFCYYTNSTQSVLMKEFAVLEQTTLPKAKANGGLIIVKPNDLPNLRRRTVSYCPRVEVPRSLGGLVAVESVFRSDGIIGLSAGLDSNNPDNGEVDIVPSSVSDIVRLKAGDGSLETGMRKMYPLFEGVTKLGVKYLRPKYYIYMTSSTASAASVLPGRKEYRLEISPMVIISRKQQP